MKKVIIFWPVAILFALSLMLSPNFAQADYVIKKIKHTDEFAMMGQTQPAKDEEGTTWMAKDKMRQDEGKDRTTIVRFDLKKIYLIDHAKKTYSEIDLPVDMEKILPPQSKQMFQMIQASASVTATEESQTIKNWKCKKYLVEIALSMMGMSMPIKMEIWASKDVGIDLNLYNKFNAEILSTNPMFKGLAEELKKMEGYPVLTKVSMNIMGAEQKYKEELVSAEEKDAPAGTYDPPKDYSITSFDPMEQKE